MVAAAVPASSHVRLGVAARGAGQAGSERFTLGVMRADGILLPFAAFDGKNWTTPWPAENRRIDGRPIDLPENLQAVPREWWGKDVPAEWRVWPRTGAAVPFK